MEIVSIFGSINDFLYTVDYDDTGGTEHESDEFHNMFDNWNDPQYLHDFFNNDDNKANLTKYWDGMSIADAIMKVKMEAFEFDNMLWKLANGIPYRSHRHLRDIFKNLNTIDYTDKDIDKRKARPDGRLPFLRLYGIEIEGAIIVTGGCIKLPHKMKDCKYLQHELKKMDRVKDFLRDKGIYSKNELISY